jgi:YbbR domain-containing protein
MTILRNKNVTKILSLLIAIVLWVYVIAFQNPPTTQLIYNIPIELQNIGNLTQNGLAISEVSRETVNVVVRGTRADIARYQDQITVVANVFGHGIGDDHVVQVNAFPATNRLVVEEVRPAAIRVTIENLVSVYKPVTLAFTGDAQPDTEPGRITVQPEQIEVKGPQSWVEAVSYVGVSVPYSQLSRDGSTLIFPVSVLDAMGEAVRNIDLSSGTVRVDATLFDTKEVPIFVEVTGEISEIYEITELYIPQTIRIRGSRSAVENIEYIEAEPIDISEVEITSQLPVRPILPEGVEPARGFADIHVNIVIKGISNKAFEYSSSKIEKNGLGEGLNAYINTPALMLKVTGKETIIDSAGEEDFRLSVDLQGLEPGAYVIPVFVSHDKELIDWEIIPGEVHITISEDV